LAGKPFVFFSSAAAEAKSSEAKDKARDAMNFTQGEARDFGAGNNSGGTFGASSGAGTMSSEVGGPGRPPVLAVLRKLRFVLV
jgi:hypothetical protein